MVFAENVEILTGHIWSQMVTTGHTYLGVGRAIVAALLQGRRVHRPVVRVRVVQLGVAERRAVGPGG